MSERRLLEGLAHDLIDTRDAARSATVAGLLDALPSRPGERPEEILVDLGLVDDRRLALSLAFHSGRRFEGLRDVAVDHRLFLYLPLSLAQRERVVPLVLFDGTLVIASRVARPGPRLRVRPLPEPAARARRVAAQRDPGRAATGRAVSDSFHRRLAEHARLPFVDDDALAAVDSPAVTGETARFFGIVPLADDGTTLVVATADPGGSTKRRSRR